MSGLPVLIKPGDLDLLHCENSHKFCQVPDLLLGAAIPQVAHNDPVIGHCSQVEKRRKPNE